jgi:hypothetical protein
MCAPQGGAQPCSSQGARNPLIPGCRAEFAEKRLQECLTEAGNPAPLVEGFTRRLSQSFDFVPDHQFPALQLDNVEVVRGKMHERIVQFTFQNSMFPFQFNEMRLNCHTKSPL